MKGKVEKGVSLLQGENEKKIEISTKKRNFEKYREPSMRSNLTSQQSVKGKRAQGTFFVARKVLPSRKVMSKDQS